MASTKQKGKRPDNDKKHPYLSGNYAPVKETCPLIPCRYFGDIPEDLAGGQYVRNGSNPVSNEDLGRDAHWFDGDGLLAGVLFKPCEITGHIEPEFVTRYVLTDVHVSATSNRSLRVPILPSISTLVNPTSTLITIILRILRTVFLVILSHLPGSRQAIKKISVANTAICYHDGRALATCESGPPIRVTLPDLETVGWYNGHSAEGETKEESKEVGFGGTGPLSFLKEFTTGHPKIDPVTNEMILYHCTFAPPYVQYSVIPASKDVSEKTASLPKLLNHPVRGVSGGKMMHDFGVSRKHSIIMDLPLTLDPINLLKNRPIVSYDLRALSRFGVFPRRNPDKVQWFETSACCIFHTANAWDNEDMDGNTTSVSLLACRLTSATIVYSAGGIAAPQPTKETVEEITRPMSFFDKYDKDFDDIDAKAGEPPFPRAYGYRAASNLESRRSEQTPLIYKESLAQPPTQQTAWTRTAPDEEDEQCRLYYYNFQLPAPNHTIKQPQITAQFALSAIPFEFPSLNPAYSMRNARYIYGCSTREATFGAALGRAARIDVLAKIDTQMLLQRAQTQPPTPVSGCVDTRSVDEILYDKKPDNEAITLFALPDDLVAQEARFVPRRNAASEDDGFLLFYVFDESQLDDEGEAISGSVSWLWILDARNMRDVVARVRLPTRVPYGLHGEWFSEEQIRGQRAWANVRDVEDVLECEGERGAWMWVRRWLESVLAS
ncbi:uncharacterized protein K452DRAFT_243023 [Aplosporella prunicola CBS 121167]|uniref:Carotenoid oxygenase n=1 Tax=Aplosporella prunicola CBS 121167 TaxID=1176127 RepID=A0A6A6BST6_9PEZI|nr:uncharacterized protein K452DRAFT_243023 [Aplosporella prunicola CBS 121167]KAF2146304.1 hypothetical protein K452DRAFT_243023 [Aplosporella prunicola CBS 121167]